MSFHQKLLNIPKVEDCLPGRQTPISVSGIHALNGNKINPPFPEEMGSLVVGMGCFWGAERVFWQLDGVWVTAVGYSGGHTPNPTYEEVCSGLTGHAEVVLVVFEKEKIDLEGLLKVFWESHDPTQEMRQGNDIGTQYRSGIWVADQDQLVKTEESLKAYEEALLVSGFQKIKTTVEIQKNFYYAEEYHQQYLHKNPNGYCGIAGTGVLCN
ncbi:MAG: peptide-methionine (S)-S-oxide reductase MsrA [Acidimicrobiales bacterium]|jgi:peptide-methionine (S)-S-oxide reductase|nr:peptide-methionine (S)-S-oxide reductase [Acidimicrobiaceae bacterium]MDP6322369.1 peptide-methionine (S)-S-oxide reductase MsrA [Acidimicrobiales bacterium]MDP6894685.1 peptide-methionine (S)-S-oxide reductase MsrA [Acidimicrobiales bacterium]HJM37680.1 peptide-methionine (S)-S-oxide reductase MsrA [Acidimicrobiales bacterium]|tara:strand:+ start:423 stop:1055 length:633 start_codon:yes stop_codon:yes gene_type:complete